MTIQETLKWLDPKNQNLPKISASTSYKSAMRVNVPIFEGEEKDLIKTFPCLKNEKPDGSKKEITEVICEGRSLWLHGLGKKEKMTPRKIRQFYGRLYLGSLAGKPKKIAMVCPTEWMEIAAMAIHVAALDPSMMKPKYKKEPVPEVILVDSKGSVKEMEKAVKHGEVSAEAKNLMRVLGAVPPNILHPQSYAEIIKKLAKDWKVSCKQVAQKDLKKYELIGAVSAGSVHNGELLVLTLHPNGKKTKKATAVFGKGLCYDSGGLQSKQSFMKTMKEDMAGSASVLGTVLDIVKNKRKLKETTYFLLPIVESMMGEKAMRADDVFTAGDGQTVEIIHTDAEGRLVLADAICYAKNNFKDIHRFMTIATLTGSCCVALGEVYTGIVCNQDGIKAEVEASGKKSGDLVHAAPWDEEYDDNNSPIADVANLGEKDRDAGWIKAGLFLYRFVPKAKNEKDQAEFCHFDIAGSIDMKGAGRAWRRKGFSSGVGVGLLSDLLSE